MRYNITSAQVCHRVMDTFQTLNQQLIEEEAEMQNLLCLDDPLTPEQETLDKPAQTEKLESQGSDNKKKAGSFRMYGMNFILTYPQCDTKKEVAVERLEQKWKDDLQGYVVCEEAHKDGTPHLHVFLKFKKRINVRSQDHFDFIAGQHGSYEVCRSAKKSVEYVTKGGNFVAKGVDVEKVKKEKMSDKIAGMLDKGKSLAEVKEEERGFFMINKRKIEEYASWIECENQKKSKLEWVAPSLDGLTDSNKQIAEWICKNIRQTRVFKAPQLFITGKPNLGKTSLIEWLKKFLSVYPIPILEDFYDQYSDDYDLVVLDEFKGQKTIQWLNEFLQGSTMNIRKKGSQSLKKKNLPVIILSNYTLEECYPKANADGRLDSLRARLEIVEVDSFIDFYKKHDDLI